MTDLEKIEPRLVWIFGSPRSGSTWLLALLGSGRDVLTVNEPGIGVHLGATLDGLFPVEAEANPEIQRLDQFQSGDDYFFAPRWERVWRPALRAMILERFGAQLAEARWAAIKEPHGSQGADILMSALPRSRMIFLLRDGRDVIDSMLDALAEDGWLINLLDGYRARDRASSIRSQAYRWLWRTEATQRAFAAHPEELSMLVRYEELRADPDPILRRLADWLGLDPEPMIELAERTAVGPEQGARGMFIRAARPGVWREHFTDEEQTSIEAIIGPKLRELGYPEA